MRRSATFNNLHVLLIAAAVLVTAALRAQVPAPAPAAIAYADAEPLFSLLRPYLPRDLEGLAAADRRAQWPAWVASRNAEIRGRVARGDEDSLVNLWLFGTSFTSLPPVAQAAGDRLDAFLDALATPGPNERLQFAREWLAARTIDVATNDGRERARRLLEDARARMVAETAEFTRRLEAANGSDTFVQARSYASLYEHRGLSSDTSVLSSFAIDAALEALRDSGRIGTGGIRRVAVIGPGLDVINKADGHDFYPEQTIQPVALVDSLLRLGLSRGGDLAVVTFDLSDRVNRHLTTIAPRAASNEGYVLHVALPQAERWTRALERYFQSFGSRIGEPTMARRPPGNARAVAVRAVRVRPEVARSLVPRDLNIVVERWTLAEDERFDLAIATNVFAYYSTFEQALAVVNIGHMLRTGGWLLSNQAVLPVPPMAPEVGQQPVVYSDRQFDTMFWYRRD